MTVLARDQLALAAHDRWNLEPPGDPHPPKPSPSPPGYYGIFSNAGIYVEPEKALAFALERSGLRVVDSAQFEMEWGVGGTGFVDVFYSGDWIVRE